MSEASTLRVVIAGGGTGGHLFPGVAVAEEILRRHPGAQVTFVGTARGIEAKVVPELGHRLELIEVSGLKTVGLRGALRGALSIPRALWQSRRLLRALDPDVVLGVGGYASGPVVLMARLRGVATAILEQNSVPGLTNKILGRVARRIFVAFADSQRFFPTRKIALVGNPIRADIRAALTAGGEPRPADAPPRLFVFGGSQGAVAVNRLVADAAGLLAARGVALDIVHQTGEADLAPTQERYRAAGVDADCRAFIRDMAAEYRAADLIVSRAGATTIAELGVAGVPAILIPYPFAADDHQVHNARELVEAGAALCVPQAELTAEGLADELAALAADPERRQRMRAAMRGIGRPDAAREVADWCDAQRR